MHALRLLLLPFSFVYATAAWVRNGLFDAGLLKKHRFTTPIILVGNLSVGGTGKTPHVEYLIRLLKKDIRVATLSRGYGRKSTGCVVAGKGATAAIIGDEPMQYHTKFNNITVAVCEKRVNGIDKLLNLPVKPEVIIMDDGFQHRSVEPGFKILLTSLDQLFTRDYVLPAGDLRESSGGYRRADCIIVTRVPLEMTEKEKEKIRKEIKPLPHQQLFFSSLVYDDAISFFSSEKLTHSLMADKKVVLFTGIANPASMISFLKKNCASLNHLKFPDHHTFTEKDIRKVLSNTTDDTIIITTEKDYLRLKNDNVMELIRHLPCFYLPIKVSIDREEEFNNLIRQSITMPKP